MTERPGHSGRHPHRRAAGGALDEDSGVLEIGIGSIFRDVKRHRLLGQHVGFVERHPGRSDGDLISVVKDGFAFEAFSVEEGSAAAMGVADVKRIAVLVDPGVNARDDALAELDPVEHLPPDQDVAWKKQRPEWVLRNG